MSTKLELSEVIIPKMDRYDHVIWGSFQDGAFVGFTDPLPLYSLLLEDI